MSVRARSTVASIISPVADIFPQREHEAKTVAVLLRPDPILPGIQQSPRPLLVIRQVLMHGQDPLHDMPVRIAAHSEKPHGIDALLASQKAQEEPVAPPKPEVMDQNSNVGLRQTSSQDTRATENPVNKDQVKALTHSKHGERIRRP